MDRLLTLEDIVKILGVSPRTVARLLKEQSLPTPIRIGKQLRWSKKQIEQFVENGGTASEVKTRKKPVTA